MILCDAVIGVTIERAALRWVGLDAWRRTTREDEEECTSVQEESVVLKFFVKS